MLGVPTNLDQLGPSEINTVRGQPNASIADVIASTGF